MKGESNNISDSRLMKGVLDEHNGWCTKANAELFSYKKLFQKKLTPNDVGNKRFVIPVKHVKKYFPHIQHNEKMDFYDRSRNLWNFRFYYCKSSQKWIFTKGWSKYVKDKALRVGDTIVFNLCESKNGITCMIDVVKNVEGLPMDLALNHHVVVAAAAAALTPVLLFGKQIGWTKTKKENEV